MTLTLRIENSDKLEQGGTPEFVLDEKGGKIGRRPGCDWVLPDASKRISGNHFEIVYKSDGYWLTDMSTNGTFLSGSRKKLDQPLKLETGQKLSVGHYVISVEVEAEEHPATVLMAIPEQRAAEPSAPEPEPAQPAKPRSVAGISLPPGAITTGIQQPGKPKGQTKTGLQTPTLGLGPAIQQPPVTQAPPTAPEPEEQEPEPDPLDEILGGEEPAISEAPPEPEPEAPSPNVSPEPETEAEAEAPPPEPAPVEEPALPSAPEGEDLIPDDPDAFSLPGVELDVLDEALRDPLADPSEPPRGTADDPFAAPVPDRPDPGLPREHPHHHHHHHHHDHGASETAGASDRFLEAFCAGAGITNAAVEGKSPEDLARILGGLLRDISAEITKIQTDRAGMGPLAPEDASAPDLADALSGGRKMVRAMREVRSHNAALNEALGPAVEKLLSGLSPEDIEGPEPQTGASLISNERGKFWDMYVNRWDDKLHTGDSGMRDVFMRALARHYLARLDD